MKTEINKMFPRAMNNKEKSMLKIIKEYGFAYELRFIDRYYYANLSEIKECWCLNFSLSKKNHEGIEEYLRKNKTIKNKQLELFE
jgi:hypothetical protein